MLGVSIEKEDEKALFSYKRRGRSRQKNHKEFKEDKFKRWIEGSYQTRGAQQNYDKRGQGYQRTNGACFVCGKRRHYARDCWFKSQ